MVINQKKITKKQEAIIVVTIVAVTSAIVIVTSNSQLQQEVRKESLAATGMEPDNATKAGPPTTNNIKNTGSTNQTFWINTVHIDGNANITGDPNTIYPPEKFPDLPLPAGGGFVLTPPGKTGAWSIRSFTFDPSMIVVHKGDRVTLHFVGVQGPHHVITVTDVESFPLDIGQIHTVRFIANQTGTIYYYCHIHTPNMVGQIFVLPKTA